MQTSTSRWTAVVVVALAALSVGAVGCVDGATPDCSDAAAHCNPDFDAYPPETGDDSSPPADAPSEGAADTGPADTAPESAAETGADAADAGKG